MLEKILSWFDSGTAKCIICSRRRDKLKYQKNGAGICFDCYNHLMKGKADDYYCADSRINRLFAPFEYSDNLRAAILSLKFKDCTAYAALIAQLVYDALPPYYVYPDYDMLLPVPLHPSRYHERGFNQAELLASALSKLIHIPAPDDVLFRTRSTAHQMYLPRRLRELNVKQAFYADEKSVKGKRIILVDDIYTVGATIGACAQELLDKGAEEVSAIVVCENFAHTQKTDLHPKIPHAYRE